MSRLVLQETDCEYVSVDNVLEKLGYDWNTNKLPDKDGWNRVMDIVREKIKGTLENGFNVLYDSTNHTRVSRDKLRELADSVGAGIKVIYMEVGIRDVRKRWRENKKTKKRFVLDERLLNMTIKAMEPPGAEEDVIVISLDLN